MPEHRVFVTGGTGYIGQALIAELLARGYLVYALVRPQSTGRLPAGAVPVIGDALNADTFVGALDSVDTIVHLVGTPRPNPTKGRAFQEVDLASIRATVMAAQSAGLHQLVYVSVAQPAPVMRTYIEARRSGETLIQASGMNATILRPWYVLGPGHWWPCVLLPFYLVLNWLPSTRAAAQRLGFVSLRQMCNALVYAVEHPQNGIRIFGVPDIKRLGI